MRSGEVEHSSARAGAMRTTFVIDDRQLASARELSGIKETSAIVCEALRAFMNSPNRL